MRVTMIGAGYVGLVSSACFAEVGHQVTCVDKDEERAAALKRGEMPIEPHRSRQEQTERQQRVQQHKVYLLT